MVDFPKIPKSSAVPPSIPRTAEGPREESKTPLSEKTSPDSLQKHYEHETLMAEAADFRRPTPHKIRDEEQGAQRQNSPRTVIRDLPQEVRERVRMIEEMGRKSVRVEGKGEAFLEYLKQHPRPQETEILLTEAEILVGMSRPKKKRKRSWRDVRKWLQEKSVYIFASVGKLFHHKS